MTEKLKICHNFQNETKLYIITRVTLIQLIVNGLDGLDGLIVIQYAAKESCLGADNHFGRPKTTENHAKYATGLIIEVAHRLRVRPQQLSLRLQNPSYRMLLR